VGNVLDSLVPELAPFYKFNWRPIVDVEIGDIYTALFASCFHAGVLLGLFLDLGDGGCMFLRNIG
jgi:hypothetical protein